MNLPSKKVQGKLREREEFDASLRNLFGMEGDALDGPSSGQ